jgi:spore coat polysaccharide biosynthesis protein SpsF
MKVVAAIQARMGSSRFPGKVLQPLGEKPVLEHVINRVKQLHVEDGVVLTSNIDENFPITRLCVEKKFPIMSMDMRSFSHNNFFDLECFYWYFSAGEFYNADYVVRVCGDNPFLDVFLTNCLIDKLTNDEYDYASYTVNGIPAVLTNYGIFAEIISMRIIKAIMEHVTVTCYTQPRSLLQAWYMPYSYRLSIDYPDDLKRANTVWKLGGRNYKTINQIMEGRPDLRYVGEERKRYKWTK